jgi:hypothetical protein
MPVRTFNNGNNQSGRGGFNSGNGQGSRSPVIGRTAQTGAAANANRPAFTQGGQSNGQRGGFPRGSNATAPIGAGPVEPVSVCAAKDPGLKYRTAPLPVPPLASSSFAAK